MRGRTRNDRRSCDGLRWFGRRVEIQSIAGSQAMRRKPNPLFRSIRDAALGAAVTAVRLPWHALPGRRHRVFAVVAAERDPKVRVVAIRDGPLAHLARNVVVFGVALLAEIVGVRRIEKYAGQANVG